MFGSARCSFVNPLLVLSGLTVLMLTAGVVPPAQAGRATSGTERTAAPLARNRHSDKVIERSTLHELRRVVSRSSSAGTALAVDGDRIVSGGEAAHNPQVAGMAGYSRKTYRRVWFRAMEVEQPVITRGLVLLNSPSAVRALRASDGKTAWVRRCRKCGTSEGVPPALAVGSRVFYVDEFNRVTAVRRSDGRLLWRNAGPNGDTLQCGLGYSLSAVYEMCANNGGRYDAKTGAALGGAPTWPFAMTTRLVFSASSTQVVATRVPCDTDCSKARWTAEPDANGPAILGVADSNGHVFVFNGTRTIYELRASDGHLQRQLVARHEPDAEVIAIQPIHDLLFATLESGRVFGFSQRGCGHRKCREIWRRHFGLSGELAVATSHDIVTNSGVIYRLVR